MAVRSRTIRAFCLGTALSTASLAFAAGSGTDPAPPPKQPAADVPTAADAQNPEIVKPDALGMPCTLHTTLQEQGKVQQNTGILVGKECMPQADAFKRAAEASSYLAFYQQNYSEFGRTMNNPEGKQKIHDAISACLTGSSTCGPEEQHSLVMALVQYNFGKQLKAQMLENQQNSELMASVNTTSQEWKQMGVAPTKLLASDTKGGVRPDYNDSLRTKTFRLDPTQLQALDFDKTSQAERDRLGQQFNRDFNQFVDEFSTALAQRKPKSRWYMVPAKVGNVFVPAMDAHSSDPELGNVKVDQQLMAADIQRERSQAVQEALQGYRTNYKDILAAKPATGAPADPSHPPSAENTKNAFNALGFGIKGDQDDNGKPVTPAQMAQAVVVAMDKSIYEAEKAIPNSSAAADQLSADQRVPSSVGNTPKKKIASVTVDALKFDAFLDDIWPPNTPKPQ